MNNNRANIDTRSIALSTVFSALSVMLTIINITIPFPLLPYLKFDFSEIPVTIAFFLVGPQYAILSTAIYWIVLTIREGDILGPAMKGVAVTSMIIGLWAGAKITKGKELRQMVTSGMLIGIILRVITMSVFNYFALTVIAPFWLDFAIGFITALGLPTTSSTQTILWVLLLTGIYNLLHTVLSMIPSVLISETSITRMPQLATNSWISKYKTEKRK